MYGSKCSAAGSKLAYLLGHQFPKVELKNWKMRRICFLLFKEKVRNVEIEKRPILKRTAEWSRCSYLLIFFSNYSETSSLSKFNFYFNINNRYTLSQSTHTCIILSFLFLKTDYCLIYIYYWTDKEERARHYTVIIRT